MTFCNAVSINVLLGHGVRLVVLNSAVHTLSRLYFVIVLFGGYRSITYRQTISTE